MTGITGKRKRVLVLTPEGKILARVHVDYARRALERGEVHPTGTPDVLSVDPRGLNELSPEAKRQQWLQKQKGNR